MSIYVTMVVGMTWHQWEPRAINLVAMEENRDPRLDLQD
jgi:hypothetical protein